MSNGAKKQRLIPHKYDEISLVDSGANQHADVLIFKREEISKRPPPGEGGWTPTMSLRIQRKNRKKTDGTTNSFERSPSRPKKKKKKGTSERARHWKEERHPRKSSGSPAGGEFDTTSSSSKKKYGKDGTTKSKLLRAKKVKPEKVVDPGVKITHHGGGGSKAPATKKVSPALVKQVEKIVAAGQPVSLGQVSDEVWELLKARGWTGRAGDNAERLYPPPQEESDPEGLAEKKKSKGAFFKPLSVNKSSSDAKVLLDKWMGMEN